MADIAAPIPALPKPAISAQQKPVVPILPTSGRRWRRRLRRLAIALVLIYMSLIMAGCFSQTWLIFPGHSTQGRPEAIVRPTPGTKLVHLTTRDGTPVVALFGPALNPDGAPRADAATRPTLLWFYGNA